MKLRTILCSVVAVLAVSLLAGCESEKGEGNEHEGYAAHKEHKEAKEAGEGDEAKEGTEEKQAKESQAQLMEQAKISKADAERIALDKAPGGTIKEGELEKEKGKLIWSFDIAKPDTQDITEVNVDAITGKIVAVDIESPKAEAKEKKQEKDDDKEGK